MADSVAEVGTMVSVVIPAYNEERTLPHTLGELFRQSGDYEAIVVDGGSTDRTLEFVQEFTLSSPRAGLRPLRLIAASRGRASQMNAGAKEGRGEWLLFLHADTTSVSYTHLRAHET